MFYQYEYPKGEDLHPLQKKYLEDYVDSFKYALRHIDFADSLRGYRHYIKVKSFIDYFLINELSRNVDGYRISTFLHKDKDEKLAIGPVWDFNLAWWNANYCEGYNDQGWAVDFNNYCGWDAFLIPFWWEYLMKDSSYTNQLRCRYEEMRKTLFHRDSLFEIIDRHANVIREARLRHFIRWPILGTYVWPNISPLPITYAQEIQAVKHFIDRRLLWMDQNMPGRCDLVSELAEIDPISVEIFPNPAEDQIHFKSNFPLNDIEFKLHDILGQAIPIELQLISE